jgi:hypothetical protein
MAVFVCLPFPLLLAHSSKDNSKSPHDQVYSSLDMTALNITNISAICKLQINESTLNNVLQLMHRSTGTTQVVELAVSISSRNETQHFPELKWAWANEIGRTISSLIAQTSPAQPWYFNTLSTGIEKVNIVVLEERYGCLSTRDNVNGTDLVFDFLLHQLSKIEDDHNYKLCHKEDSKIYKCCSVIGFGNLKLCTDYSSIALEYANEYIIAMTIITGIIRAIYTSENKPRPK